MLQRRWMSGLPRPSAVVTGRVGNLAYRSLVGGKIVSVASLRKVPTLSHIAAEEGGNIKFSTHPVNGRKRLIGILSTYAKLGMYPSTGITLCDGLIAKQPFQWPGLLPLPLARVQRVSYKHSC
jgi:hypothetical protein